MGGQHGALMGNATIASNAVRFDGNGDYVNLPGALITALQSVTFECWFTYSNNGAWARVFDLGGTNPATGMGRYCLFYTPHSGANTSRLVICDTDPGNNHEEILDHTRPPQGVPVYVACVYDGVQKTMSLYVDGLLAKSRSVTIPLSAVDDVLGYLGRSLYNDPYLLGSIDEFRVYDSPLTAEEVGSNYAIGPDVAQASYIATQPSPMNQAVEVQPGTVFSWVPPAMAPSGYTVHVSDNPQFTGAQRIVTPRASCTPVLAHDTTYYWYVVSYYGVKTYSSAVWTFATEERSSVLSPVPEQNVVINEIHYHEDNNTEAVEFIELYNAFTEAVDLSGWSFADGVDYVFPQGTQIAANGYLVIGQDPEECLAKFGVVALGPFGGKLSNEGEDLVLCNAAGGVIDAVDYDSDFPWPIAANGEGGSMELIHPSLDNDLAGSWRSSAYNDAARPESAFGSPTPGRKNSVYSRAVPPQIRQVRHRPEAPVSGEPVRITAKVTDPDGVHQVRLKVQYVDPGAYIPAYLPVSISSLVSNPSQDRPLNPAFEAAASWIEVAMTDDGTGEDQKAHDDVYTAAIPGQTNRTLVRYRIEAEDEAGHGIRVPYADDPSLNFAYYVYDGVPDYVAGQDSVAPGGPGHVHPSEVLTSLPVYTLITRAADLYQCNGYSAADRIDQGTTSLTVQEAGRAYNWEGAFVYEGKVYDHIGYRLRGGNGRYNYGSIAGKRSMKFRFNRGDYFQARDIYGTPFPSKWQHLNTGKMFGNQITFANYRRYPYGLNEVIDMRLFQAFGVPAPETYWIHLRVVDGPQEAPTGKDGQYLGDFWGLHIAFENYDGAFLDRLGLPKGNLYKLADKIYDGLPQLRYQGPDAVDDASDYENIRWDLTYQASAAFIREYLDCDEWYRYHTVVEAIRHYDIFTGATCVHCLKNAAWYFYPDYSTNPFGKLQWLPFDVDDTWGPFFNRGIDHAKGAIYDQSYIDHVFTQYTVQPDKAALRQEYRNRIREFRDLHWQPEVIDGMIDELAAVIADFVPADRDRWRLDRTVPGTSMDNGTLEECVALMKQFAWKSGTFQGGFSWVGSSNNLDTLANAEGDSANLPNTPTIQYKGPAGYPVHDLRFETSAFSDRQGASTFAAMQWRIAEHALNYRPATGDQEIVLLAPNAQWKYFKGTQEPSSPASAWRQAGFNDSGWLVGQTPIGFGDNDDNTDLSLHAPPMLNNYSTVYLRNTFQIQDKDQVQSLKLRAYVDDGCIVWINGTEVKRLYCSDGDKAYDAATGSADHEATGYEEAALTAPYPYLVNGTNVIAVQALQYSISSSDFSIDVSVSMTDQETEPGVPVLGRSKYELLPVWQSDELTNAGNRLIQIPEDNLAPGSTYRVRCRMKDKTGRWSHWSAPIEFVAGEATN
ncbi:MAG: lamin tail domain-containing protein [Phycisphaerae bacterium]|nr:lamin tail domain-containing protein [Phycisphaerae bacterium]